MMMEENMTQKIHIERNTVQETLIIPLYGRKLGSELFPELFTDSSAKKICEKLDYDFSVLDEQKNSFLFRFGTLEAIIRQMDMRCEIEEYLAKYPKASIVNLGCGLDDTGRVCDNGSCKIFNVDFPDVIEIRNRLIPIGERERNIACDLKNYEWMEHIDASNGVIFFAAGVFYYFKYDEVRDLAITLSKRFRGSCLVFDSVGKTGLRLMLSKTLKNMGIKDVDGFFYLNNPKSDLQWGESIQVRSKGYMLGYFDMKIKGISVFHRLLARIGDKYMKMAINRLYFQ